MAQQKNFYDILGVSRDASDKDIKVAFRKLSQKYHPDAPGGDETKFKEISEAYTTLSNPEKRREYDQMLMYGMPGSGGNWQGASSAGWSDILDSMFSGGGFNVDFGGGADPMGGNPFGGSPFGGRAQRVARKGKDLTITVNVSAQEALTGTERKLTYRIPSTSEQVSITVRVPEGAVDGGKLRYKRRGDYGQNGGERGDLIVVTRVGEDPLYKRQGADIYMQVPVSMTEAALGCSIDVPTPLGKVVRLKVPAGTQTGKKFRFKDLGTKDVRHKDRMGALLVEIKVVVPTNLSSAEKDLLTKLSEEDNRSYRSEIDALLKEKM